MPKENCRSHAPSDRKYKSFYSIGALESIPRPKRSKIQEFLLDRRSRPSSVLVTQLIVVDLKNFFDS